MSNIKNLDEEPYSMFESRLFPKEKLEFGEKEAKNKEDIF